MNDNIKTIKPLGDSAILIDWVTETVIYEIKKQESVFLVSFLATLTALLVQPVIPSVVKSISGTVVRRAGRGYMDKNCYFCSFFRQNQDYWIFQLQA